MPSVLLIDDEPAIHHAFRRAFRDEAFTFASAESAAEGVAAVVAAPPDVVILDVHLPDATGLETFLRIR